MYTPLVASPDSAPPQVESDSIPRVSHLLAHLRDQLVGMRENTTFEAARRRYAATVERLEFEGVGRRTTSRGDEATAYWSPTVEVLEEAMRLGFVEREQLPSARRYVDAHRARVYRLTSEGQDASELAQRLYGEFVDRITVAITDGHPYFRRLLELLDERPLMIPVISQGDLDRARTDGQGTQWWAEYVAGILNEAAPTPLIDADEVTEEIGAAVRKRFGARPDSPTSKAVSEALNDAFIAAAIRALVCRWARRTSRTSGGGAPSYESWICRGTSRVSMVERSSGSLPISNPPTGTYARIAADSRNTGRTSLRPSSAPIDEQPTSAAASV